MLFKTISSSNKQSPIKRRLRELLRSVSEAAFRTGKYKNKPGGNCRNITTGRMVTQGLRCSLNSQPLFYADMLDGVDRHGNHIKTTIERMLSNFRKLLIDAGFISGVDNIDQVTRDNVPPNFMPSCPKSGRKWCFPLLVLSENLGLESHKDLDGGFSITLWHRRDNRGNSNGYNWYFLFPDLRVAYR